MAELQVNLTGKVAIVTGGSKGIGKASAIGLARAGAKVAVISRTKKDLEEVKQEIEENGGTGWAVACDVRNTEDIEKMVEEVMQWQGKIDILVNSAGINIQETAEEVKEESWDKVLDINTKGTFFCCQAVGREMIKAKQGKIINITSTMARVGFYRRAAYCASKGAVEQFSKVLAVEWAPYNIQINNVAPTFIKTPLTEPMFEDAEFYNEVVSRIPLGKVGETDDVVGAVLFLASDASDFITGSSVMVDGGWTAW